MTISVSADKFKAAWRFISKDNLRLYLRGVHIEPHPQGGVYLVATDGHRLICVHDADGTCNQSALVAPPPYLLKLCTADTTLTVLGDGVATLFQKDGGVVASAPKALIDGTFPDWRRVVPKPSAQSTAAGFNAAYVGDFGKAASELTGNKTPPVYMFGESPLDPQIIRFEHCDFAFGVLMPIRIKTGISHDLPDFFERGGA